MNLHKKKTFLLPIVLLGISTLSQAQQSSVAAGGDTKGTNGTVSYSIGQLVDDTYSDGNNTVTQGVQQPYEVSNPLPLQLLSFTASLQGNQALLTWKTTHEQNVHHFEVEKKASVSNNFSFLASLPAKGGNGNELYRYNDNLVTEGVTYYRLKEVDNNGLDSYSQLVLVNMALSKIASLKVYPNPVITQLNITFNATESKTYQLLLVNALGRTVINKTVSCQAGNNTINWNVAQLAAGTYTLKAVGIDVAPIKIIRN